MGLRYFNLDQDTRNEMLGEFQTDVEANRTYPSARFTPHGHARYQEHVRTAIISGDDDSLAEALRRDGAFAAFETSHRKGIPYTKAVPHDAHTTYAEGEFNRYYIRGVCSRAIREGWAIEVVRAKEVEKPRTASLALIGTRPVARQLLDSLRTSERVDMAFGIPPGPNSGLSIRLLVGVPTETV